MMDPATVKALMDGGLGLAAIYFLHGVQGQLGRLQGTLETLVKQTTKGEPHGAD